MSKKNFSLILLAGWLLLPALQFLHLTEHLHRLCEHGLLVEAGSDDHKQRHNTANEWHKTPHASEAHNHCSDFCLGYGAKGNLAKATKVLNRAYLPQGSYSLVLAHDPLPSILYCAPKNSPPAFS